MFPRIPVLLGGVVVVVPVVVVPVVTVTLPVEVVCPAPGVDEAPADAGEVVAGAPLV